MRYLFLILILFCAVLQAAQPVIPIEKYTLKNGMRVILSRDNAVPVVTVYMIFDIGARAEEKGRTGFAHLFEHMMFEGSQNAPKGTHFKVVQSNGGTMNGSTHPDFTDYYEIMPSNKLAVALWLESDRMRSLALTAENLANQKEAVKQERRLRFDNQPYSTAIVDHWPQLVFQNWQNSHSLIGSFEDLNAATLDDVTKFFKAYYAPDNAVLVIVGDIQIPDAKKLIETYFGDIPSQPKPQRVDLSEPSELKPRSEVYRDPMARVPAVVIGYPGPKRRSPDYYAVNMADMLLTGGPSSRVELNLIKESNRSFNTSAALGWPFRRAHRLQRPGLYAMFMLYKPNFTAEQIVEQAQEEIAKLQKEGVDSKELERARTCCDPIGSVAAKLAAAGSTAGAIRNLRRQSRPDQFGAAKYLAVTPPQIQAVAKKYLTPEKRSVLRDRAGA